MKKLGFIVSSMLAMTVAQAATYYGPTDLNKQTVDEIVVHGPATLNQVQTKRLSVMGPLEFKDLKVTEKADVVGPIKNGQLGQFTQLKVTGPVQIKQAEIGSLQTIGPVQVDNVIVKGETVIIGPLTANKSKFQNLTITADQINLTNVEIGNIYVKPASDNKPQVVYLKGKTTVTGSIQFEAKNGQVVTQGKNAVVQGQVVGGEVKK